MRAKKEKRKRERTLCDIKNLWTDQIKKNNEENQKPKNMTLFCYFS